MRPSMFVGGLSVDWRFDVETTLSTKQFQSYVISVNVIAYLRFGTEWHGSDPGSAARAWRCLDSVLSAQVNINKVV